MRGRLRIESSNLVLAAMLLTAAIVVRETRDTPHLPRLGRRVRGQRARG